MKKLSMTTLTEASNNISDAICNVIDNDMETFIVSNKGTVVMIPEGQWTKIQETLRLVRDKRSLAALLDGHRRREEGQTIKAKTIDEAFYDLPK